MYEYTKRGMGWSDISGYPSCAAITGGGIKRCFTIEDADVRCANSCGCHRTTESCRTSSGNAGFAWCCPRDCPNPNAAPGQGCVSASRNLICDLNRVNRNTMTTDRERAVWDIKNKLCIERFDPGNLNGSYDRMTSEALIAVQARNRIPQTGEADAVTLRLLGFSASDAQRLANALAEPETVVPPVQLPWGLIAASSVASVFMLYAVWQFTKRPKR